MDDMIRVSIFISVISAAFAASSSVPAIVWTNDDGTTFPSPLTGHTVNADDFHQQYLEKQLVKNKHNLVVFLQDKLSIEDITHHADAYNEQSDGAAFHNLKNIVEKMSSAQLPSLQSPADVIDKLSAIFDGRVHHVNSPYSVKDLPLGDENGVIIVKLPATTPTNTKQAFADTDRIIGSVHQQMMEMGRPFTALYTAHKPSVVHRRTSSQYQGRHLLQEKAETNNATFWNVSGCLYVYVQNISIVVFKPQAGEKDKVGVYTLPATKFDESTKCTEAGATLVVKYDNFPKQGDVEVTKFELTMVFQNFQNSTGYWNTSSVSMNYAGSFDGSQFNGENEQVTRRMIRDMMAPYRYSYHCSYQPDMLTANSTTKSDALKVGLRMEQLQMQLFGTSKQAVKFGQVNDCTGFFSLAAWSALISMLVLILIFFLGLWMITGITTQDRFDDPKGKAIQVNVNE